ncbi:hypothetical protein BH20ACI2_BH20ACI2_09700 [soil metagenome]
MKTQNKENKKAAASADLKVPVAKSGEKTVKKASKAASAGSGKDAEVSPAQKAAVKKTKVSVKSLPASAQSATSPVKKVKKAETEKTVAKKIETPSTMSRVDKVLAEPELPELERENRARLQMQTPTRLYFYWSVGENPWALLRRAFGDETGSYTLVLKLVEPRTEAEQIYNAEPEGNWWFDVEPDREYRAEIGFYAPNRPYFRIVFSNSMQTPRRKPSPRKATEADWTVTADRFAKVLDVAGFSRDAVDVAIAGDDAARSASATHMALNHLTGGNGNNLNGVDDEDIRYAMVSLAVGHKLEELRWKISAELFAYLQANEIKLGEENARVALKEHFDIEDFDFETEEFGPAVFGASLVNFPRTRRSRRPLLTSRPDLAPVSSHSFQRQ